MVASSRSDDFSRIDLATDGLRLKNPMGNGEDKGRSIVRFVVPFSGFVRGAMMRYGQYQIALGGSEADVALCVRDAFVLRVGALGQLHAARDKGYAGIGKRFSVP